ncbi:flagellar hook protein FlgE [Breoghania corrubedonensis]|uniref:Flagellar hook protein FlgE n=1 Tax=Breoghania corrubedonensis TaxID=665038 RepID=A0A2T5V8S8_9HYPH|nr:flagellar hook protein FlgE [Breoghania corrubedonensis]PTW60162.1 flagellar hook protein FlgE [Breoghania corrubedonensis]
MSLFGVMRTGVSGMNAQSSKLGTVADNIANSSTTGYKRAESEFSSQVLSQGSGSYNSGGVKATTVYSISEGGAINYTTSGLDLAIDGSGFFVVADEDGTSALTRAGSFVVDNKGYLVNTAGYYLQGYPVDDNGNVSTVANGTGGLERINVSQNTLEATPTDEALLWANVPEDATVVTGDTPAANLATSTYSAKTSITVYDNLGNELTLDVYYTKLSETGTDSDWEITVYNAADAAAGGGFPYTSPALSTDTFTFDVTTGDLTATSPTALNITIPNGGTFDIDMSKMTYLNADFSVTEVNTNGNAPSAVESVEFDDDGTLYAVYANGARKALYKVPVADVASPDKLTPVSGNVYQVSNDSGDMIIGFAGKGGMGSIEVGALEASNVDLATELTSMIEAQRTYTANSKVFQAGSDLLETLVNMAR